MLGVTRQEFVNVPLDVLSEHPLHFIRIVSSVVELVETLYHMGVASVCEFECARMPLEEQVFAVRLELEAVVHRLAYRDHAFLALDAKAFHPTRKLDVALHRGHPWEAFPVYVVEYGMVVVTYAKGVLPCLAFFLDAALYWVTIAFQLLVNLFTFFQVCHRSVTVEFPFGKPLRSARVEGESDKGEILGVVIMGGHSIAYR